MLNQFLLKKLNDIQLALELLSKERDFASAWNQDISVSIPSLPIWMHKVFCVSHFRRLQNSQLHLSVLPIVKIVADAAALDSRFAGVSDLLREYNDLIEGDIPSHAFNQKRDLSPEELLEAIEDELRQIGIGDEIPKEKDIDPRFLYPDQYLRGVFLPREKLQLECLPRSAENMQMLQQETSTLLCELALAPRAARLVHLLKYYTGSVSFDYDGVKQQTDVAKAVQIPWRLSIPKNEIEERLREFYQGLQKTTRVKGFKLGEAPLNQISASFSEQALSQVTKEVVNGVIEDFFKGNPGCDLLFTLRPLNDSADFVFYATSIESWRPLSQTRQASHWQRL